MAITVTARHFFSYALLASISLCATTGLGQTSYPMLMSIEPVAAQVGQASEHQVRSRYDLQGAYEVLVSGSGVRGQIVPEEIKEADKPSKDKDKDKTKTATAENLAIRFTVEKDAIPGVRDIRVATPRGVSTVAQLVIVNDPVIYEIDENNKPELAQKVALPATLCGKIEKAEDVDWFTFHAKSGDRYCFHMMCLRLQDRIHDLQQHADPILTIRDSKGSTVAMSDNERSGDPLIVHTFDREDDYRIEVRDVRFQGNTYWQYSLEINHSPVLTTTFPVGIAAAKKTSVDLLGYGFPGPTFAEFTAPSPSGNDIHSIPVTVEPGHLRLAQFAVTELPLTLESSADNDLSASAQSIELPGGINGRIEKEGDVDYFGFDAKKGQRFSFEVFARRVGSALDSHLRILDQRGNQVQLSDDMKIGKRNYADSWIENWTVPSDGKYFLEVRDLHLRGGPAFVYFVKLSTSEPYFTLFADTDKTPLTPGTAGIVYVRAENKNGFDGEIQLTCEGLPQGVRAHCGRILAGKAQDGCIIFETESSAVAPLVANIEIGGQAVLPPSGDSKAGNETLTASACVYQEIYQPGGGRGHWPVTSHVLAVTAPSDLRKVSVSTNDIVLKPGESQKIEIEIERAEGFDKNVTLEATYSHLAQIFGSSLPEGITIDATASNTLLTGGATKGWIVLKAAPNASPVEKQQFAIMANVSLNFVMKATYASRPIALTIAKNP